MVNNIQIRVEVLHRKHNGNSAVVSLNDVRQVFQKDSLENAPKNLMSDPVCADVFKSYMPEVLNGDYPDAAFPLGKVMQKTKEAQEVGCEYNVYRNSNGRPAGCMHMVPSQISGFCRFSDIYCSGRASQDTAHSWMCWLLSFRMERQQQVAKLL